MTRLRYNIFIFPNINNGYQRVGDCVCQSKTCVEIRVHNKEEATNTFLLRATRCPEAWMMRFTALYRDVEGSQQLRILVGWLVGWLVQTYILLFVFVHLYIGYHIIHFSNTFLHDKTFVPCLRSSLRTWMDNSSKYTLENAFPAEKAVSAVVQSRLRLKIFF